MGATKRLAELVLQAKHASSVMKFGEMRVKTRFSMVRFGNVLGSSGSVVPLFSRQIAQGGPITLTDERITRYFMTIPEAAQLVVQASAMATGGDVFVLDMGKSVKILDLARAVCKNCNIKYTGIRPGEKLHEEMISSYDARNTVDTKSYYIILNENLLRNYKKNKLVSSNFYYRSDSNKNFLDAQDLKKIISNI
jgi:FlaA1/EpsC-like NDP-sugar epimerase